jgi:hypothetical protein
MLLDSIAAPLHWFRPFGGGTLELVRVPTCPEASNVCHSLTAHWPCEAGHWVRDMLCHWTFLLELGIVLAAILLLASGWGRRRARAESG